MRLVKGCNVNGTKKLQVLSTCTVSSEDFNWYAITSERNKRSAA